MHFGFWLNNDYHADPIGTGKKFGPILKDGHLKTIVEIGFPGIIATPDLVDDMGSLAATRFAEKIKAFESATQMHIDEIECELRLKLFGIVAERHPTWSADDISQQITGVTPASGPSKVADRSYWPDFLKTMRASIGDRPINIGCPPVYVPWKNSYVVGRDMRYVRTADLDAGKKPKAGAPALVFDGPAFWGAIFQSNTTGFVCDSPWFLIGDEKLAAKGYRQKVVDLTRFVHARDKAFSFIVNASPSKSLAADGFQREATADADPKYDAEWDRRYTEQSMKSLVTYQLAGGRADRYIFESWYDGPFTIVPDTQPNTFTNLVRQAILFLKGPGQTLRLSAKPGPAGVSHVTLTNTGKVACLAAIQTRAANAGVTVKIENTDLTADAATEEGATIPHLLVPDESLDLTVTGQLTVQAMWNPQDPSHLPRATVSIP